MTILSTSRTTANTVDQHITDHDELHRLHNILDGSSQPSTGGGAGAASIGGAGVATRGSQINTLASDDSVRNVLDDGGGNMSVAGDLDLLGTLDIARGFMQNGTTLGVSSTDGTTIHLDYTTPWGITSGGNVPYYDPGHVTSGEEAILMPDLTLVQTGL